MRTADVRLPATNAREPLPGCLWRFQPEIMRTPVEELELSIRSVNVLHRVGVNTLSDLAAWTVDDLHSIANFGKPSLDDVIETLRAHGLQLRRA